MFIRLLMSIILIALAASAVVAQPVSDAQTICFFFDEEATIRSYYGTGVIVGYLVTNSLWVGGQWAEHLQRWTSTFYWSASPDVVGNCNVWPTNGFPSDYHAISGSVDIDVTCDIPLTVNGPTVVAMVGFFVTMEGRVSIFISPGEFWANGGQNAPFDYLLSGPDGPMDITEYVANINGPAPVANEQSTWGGVKLLYR